MFLIVAQAVGQSHLVFMRLTWIDPRLDRDTLPVPKKIGPNTWEDKDGCVYKAVQEANEILIVHDPTLDSKSNGMDFDQELTFVTDTDKAENSALDHTIKNGAIKAPDPFIFSVIDYHTIYHLDGATATHHMPMLASLPRLDCIQYIHNHHGDDYLTDARKLFQLYVHSYK